MTEKRIAPTPAKKARLKKLDAYIPVEYCLRFLMSFLLARVRITEGAAPFGVAFTAAAPPGMRGLATLAGTVLGAVTCGNMIWSLKYIVASAVIRAMLFILKNTALSKSAILPAVTAFITMGCVGSVYALDSGWALMPTVMYVVETFLAGGCTFFYSVALSPWEEQDSGRYGKSCHSVSAVILISTLLMSIGMPTLFGVLSIGRTAAVIIILFCVFKGGTGSGTVVAAALGASMDLICGGVPFFTMSYTFSALISGLFSKSGRLSFLLSFISASAIAVLWNWENAAMIQPLYETFAGAVIFMLLPDSLLTRLGVMFFPSGGTGFGFLKAREYTRERVDRCSDAFLGLYNTVKDSSGEDVGENVSLVFKRASDTVCRSCSNQSRCWQAGYSDTMDIMNNLTDRLMKKGSIIDGDFPARFAAACPSIGKLTSAINAETRVYLCRKAYRARLKESRGAAFNQYNDIAAVLKSLSEELGSEVRVEPAAERKLQRYLRGINIDASTAIFRVRGGRLRAEIRASSLHSLFKDRQYLTKLSEVLGTRLCASAENTDENRLVLLEAEPLAVKIGISGARKSGEQISGDNGTCFRTDEGYMYVLLSDGTGSGADAAAESRAATNNLEKFLKAGVTPEVTLKILSDLMILKSDSNITSATIDMMCLNMFSGEAKIFKYGAAPSYLKKGSTVKRISFGSLSSGVLSRGSSGNVYAKMNLSPESFAVLISDGVISGRDDKWLKEMLSAYSGDDPTELSRSILARAVELTGCSDDMTVLVLKLERRQ